MKTNPIDTPQEVKQSNDKNIKKDFPGYPHYPASEDIMNQKDKRVENNEVNSTATGSDSETDKEQPTESDNELEEASLSTDFNEADITQEELNILQEDDGVQYAREAHDLDVPGSELDDENESIGEEDEENNYYSLGGDNHEDIEEDKL